MTNKRSAEILTEKGWEHIPFAELTKGDIFRLYEPTGEMVTDDEGCWSFVALSNVAVLSESGELYIETEGISTKRNETEEEEDVTVEF